jgi:hypothetical protein
MCRRMLAQIPTLFGRLVYIASLRDPSTGRHTYQPMIEMVGQEVAERTLAVGHHAVFAEWIVQPLSRQRDDITEYFRHAALETADRYRELVPGTALDVERQLFLTDLETLLMLLPGERRGAASTPGS